MDNLDLLFTQVGEMNTNQQKMQEQVTMNTKVVEQMLQDQQTLTKKIQANGKAITNLTLNQARQRNKQPGSPTSSDTFVEENPFQNRFGKPHPHKVTSNQHPNLFHQNKD